MSHERTERLIRGAFIGDLSARQRRQMHSHLQVCSRCRAIYARHQQLESLLCDGETAGPHLPTVFQLERVQARIFNGFAESTSAAPVARRWTLASAASLVAAASVAALLVAVLPRVPERDHVALAADDVLTDAGIVPRDILQAKGSVDVPGSRNLVGVRLFRVAGDAQIEEVAEGARLHGSKAPEVGLTLGDIATFAYTSDDDEDVDYLVLVGQQDDGLRWYYPGPEIDDDQAQSVRVKPRVVDEPMGDGILLEMHHEAGPLRIIAVFSNAPLRRQDVRQLLEETTKAFPERLQGITRLAREVRIYSFSVDIGEGNN